MIIYNYITTNKINNKQYVGMHCADSINDDYLGSGKALKIAIKKYGKDCFIKEILCICDNLETAHINESKYIELYDTLSPKGYNLNTTGGLMCNGGKYSDESKKRIKESLTGRKLSDNHKESVRRSMIGRECKWSEKISKAHKGKTLSEEHKAKLSEAKIGKESPRKGAVHTEESKEKNRIAHLGKKSPMKGKYHTDEAKRKNSKSNLGRVPWNKGIPSTNKRNERGQFIKAA